MEGQECDWDPSSGAWTVPCRSQPAPEVCFSGQRTWPELCFRCSSLEVVILSTTTVGEACLEAVAFIQTREAKASCKNVSVEVNGKVKSRRCTGGMWVGMKRDPSSLDLA